MLQDPPGYFEHVIWPGYVEAHKRLFVNEDVEHGKLIQPSKEVPGDGSPVKDLVLFEAESVTLQDIVDVAAKAVEKGLSTRTQSVQ